MDRSSDTAAIGWPPSCWLQHSCKAVQWISAMQRQTEVGVAQMGLVWLAAGIEPRERPPTLPKRRVSCYDGRVHLRTHPLPPTAGAVHSF